MSEEEIIGQLAKICDIDGKELKPKESAKLFHKLGLISKTEALKQEDKIKLIQSAALFNAAIFRNPENVEEIKHDLKLFCSQFLTLANASNPKDLIEVSQLIANDIDHMRNKVILDLAEIKKIPEDISQSRFEELKMKKVESVINLQNFITQTYAKIMKRVAGFCEEIMGNPPCRYALVGLGSLSRKEITPYSDFENIIVLDDVISSFSKEEEERIKEHFRWYAVIFQIILINLGETILPAVYIPSLNNGDPNKFNLYDCITTLGISFDGMMPHACKSPLGRQMKTKDKQFTLELIQTASKMASFIGSDENMKNGYHLADMLMTSCFVSGSQQLYQHFQECVDKEISLLDKKAFLSSIEKQIRDNSRDFEIFKQLQQSFDSYKINVKRMVYRSSTIFVSAIGKIHGIKESCCFDILEKLIQQNTLTEEIGKDLKFAIAVACEIRLRVYMNKKSQDDVVMQSQIKNKLIDSTVGTKSFVEYFKVITPFQENIFNLNNIGQCELQIIPRTCYYLHNYTYAVDWGNETLTKSLIDSAQNKQMKLDVCFSFYWVGLCKFDTNQYSEAISDMKTSLEMHLQIPADATKKKWISIYHYWIGRSCYDIGRYDEALVELSSSLKMKQQISDNPSTDTWISSCHFWLGCCRTALGIHEVAIKSFQTTIEIHLEVDKNVAKSSWIALCYWWMGICKYELEQYEESLEFTQRSLRIEEKITLNPNAILNVARNHYRIGLCHYKLGKRKNAIASFVDSLNIFIKVKQNVDSDSEIANDHYWVGVCKYDLCLYEEALPELQLSLKIRKNITKDSDSTEDVADSYYFVGMCKHFLGQFESAIPDLQNSLEIYKNVCVKKTLRMGGIYRWISSCKMNIICT